MNYFNATVEESEAHIHLVWFANWNSITYSFLVEAYLLIIGSEYQMTTEESDV